MRSYAHAKRTKTDYCNICGEMSPLTWDHVPPQSCLNEFPVKFNQFMQGIPRYNKYNKSSQNGVKYRSICSRCNNDLLGNNYDRALIDFTTQIVTHIAAMVEEEKQQGSNTIALKNLRCEVEINKLARAICGHLLAAKKDYDAENKMDQAVRAFFLNPKQKPPENLSLLTWFYPYSTIVIMRDFLVANILDRLAAPIPLGMCNIMSSFPMAYALCESNYTGTLSDLFGYCTDDINEKITVDVDFSSCFLATDELRHPLWPCYISEKFGGTDLVFMTKHTTDDSVVGIRSIKLTEE